jgi:predicted glutamine amidotransferase
MCRLVAYTGEPILLENLVVTPQRSLVHQSMQADEAKVTTNGDGFGLGWYTGDVDAAGAPQLPAIYREVTPAWSDENLLSLCAAVRSPLFFAHVRATTGTAVARHNCHPFRYGKYLFMHNGQIGDYAKVRRELESSLPDHLYAHRRGATDSELMFLLTVAIIEAGAKPVDAMTAMLEDVRAKMQARAIKTALRFTAVLSDGESLFVMRYASDSKPPSLYLCACEGGTVVASEPLHDRDTPSCPEWFPVPLEAALTVRGKHVERQPLKIGDDSAHGMRQALVV